MHMQHKNPLTISFTANAEAAARSENNRWKARQLPAEMPLPPEQEVQAVWSHSAGKRLFDIIATTMLLLLCSPVILIVALAVKLSSKGPVLFRQIRVGKDNSKFLMWKFRTMRTDCAGGPCVTKTGDNRVTPVGAFLRRFKLDELPQLFNVLRGEMSLVGPRPKVPHHETQILRYRPGVTGAASLAFREEEELLRHLPDHSLDDYQVKVLMPIKRQLDSEYMLRATLASDLILMLHTVLGRGYSIREVDLLHFQESLATLGSALSAGGKFTEINRRAVDS
jgi:lipopolysaccharide/colanic/teichoic acid biosynthesis glycosyltransferase